MFFFFFEALFMYNNFDHVDWFKITLLAFVCRV